MYDDDLTNLEDWLRRLKVEYDIYFNGHRKRPPEDLRLRVEKLAKKLSEASNMTFQQRFRYNTLVTRFHVFRDLWRRIAMEREAGLSTKEESVRLSDKRPVPAAPQAAKANRIRVSIADPEQEEEKVRQLYDYLRSLRGKHQKEAVNISYEQFAKYISTKTQNIRGKYGCSSVVFDISLEEDAIKFTARAEGRG